MSNKKPIDVIVAGHICLDIIPMFANIRADKVGDIQTPAKLKDLEISEDNWIYDDGQKLWRGSGEK